MQLRWTRRHNVPCTETKTVAGKTAKTHKVA